MNVPTRIGAAGPKGKGVFAAAPVRRSSTIAEFAGRPRWIWDIPERIWPYTIQVDYDRYVVPRRKGVIWYMNHSCAPNCVISGNRIVADRDIEEGEEITFDYSTDVDWAGFRMKCSCGSPGCRKVVRAYRYLPAKLKKRYGSRVAPFILKGYLQKETERVPGPVRPAGRRASPPGP
ncbi:MAG TPA: SET domain-containing protein-lysine N-methyltransferase [Nitrososphaerales archaeon]|nr:SET domain-containing protein-lysine N-methyltransferase [Nitrososphaerales archaeon]